MVTFNKMLVKDVKRGTEYHVWQTVEEYVLLGYVDANGEAVKLPKIYEAEMLDIDLEVIE
jgi:hypothetical protein